MSVMQYGMPHNDGLICDHPTCKKLANWRIVIKQAGPDREIFSCIAHETACMTGHIVIRNEMLAVPGNRNPPPVQEEVMQ